MGKNGNKIIYIYIYFVLRTKDKVSEKLLLLCHAEIIMCMVFWRLVFLSLCKNFNVTFFYNLSCFYLYLCFSLRCRSVWSRRSSQGRMIGKENKKKYFYIFVWSGKIRWWWMNCSALWWWLICMWNWCLWWTDANEREQSHTQQWRRQNVHWIPNEKKFSLFENWNIRLFDFSQLLLRSLTVLRMRVCIYVWVSGFYATVMHSTACVCYCVCCPTFFSEFSIQALI